MDQNTWLTEVKRRITYNEGFRGTRYYDTFGVPTVGIGLNLLRPDASALLTSAGVSNPTAVMVGEASITIEQGEHILQEMLPTVISDASSVLPAGIFYSMTDARRCALVDMCYNLGVGQLSEFTTFLSLLDEAQKLKNRGSLQSAHTSFVEAAEDLHGTAWFEQVGNRAKRDAAMIQMGEWCSAIGDGADVL